MADPNCLPPCAPNTAGGLPVKSTPATTPPTTISVNTCADNITETVDVSNALPLQVTFPIGTVMLTRPCSSEFDHSILCDTTTGAKIVVVTTYTAAGLPTTTFFNLDGTAYAGTAATLEACASGLESDSLDWCLNGVAFTQWIVKDKGEPTGTAFWTNEAGAIVAAPVGATRGVCVAAVDNPQLIYIERNGGTITMGDIVAASGAVRILSVTVKQISGTGSVTADSGSGSPMDAGETWSWSSSSTVDHFSTSVLTMDAGGGEQRITAVYTL